MSSKATIHNSIYYHATHNKETTMLISMSMLLYFTYGLMSPILQVTVKFFAQHANRPNILWTKRCLDALVPVLDSKVGHTTPSMR